VVVQYLKFDKVLKMIELFNEDCMEVMARYPDNHFDLAIVDPPYGIGKFWEKSLRTKYNHESKDWNMNAPGKEYFDELMRVSINQIIWGANYYCHHLPITNSWIFWDKERDVEKSHMSEGELAWTSFSMPMRKVKCIWDGARKGVETGIKIIHPCQRPVTLHKWILSKYAKPGEKILDTHLGSGSSAIAAHYFGVDFVGCEIDEDYFKSAEERIDQATRQEAMF
jgi:site-specific DNA-methyltransferase (adenine-specific)